MWDSKQFIECGEPWPNSGVPVHGYHDLALNHECKPKTLLCLLRQSPHNKPTCPVMRETETWGQHPTALSDVTPQVLNSPFHDNRGQCTWCYMQFFETCSSRTCLRQRSLSWYIHEWSCCHEKRLVHSCPQNAQPPRRAQSWKHRRTQSWQHCRAQSLTAQGKGLKTVNFKTQSQQPEKFSWNSGQHVEFFCPDTYRPGQTCSKLSFSCAPTWQQGQTGRRTSPCSHL